MGSCKEKTIHSFLLHPKNGARKGGSTPKRALTKKGGFTASYYITKRGTRVGTTPQTRGDDWLHTQHPQEGVVAPPGTSPWGFRAPPRVPDQGMGALGGFGGAPQGVHLAVTSGEDDPQDLTVLPHLLELPLKLVLDVGVGEDVLDQLLLQRPPQRPLVGVIKLEPGVGTHMVDDGGDTDTRDEGTPARGARMWRRCLCGKEQAGDMSMGPPW